VRILAALVNPIGADLGKESVTLINVSPDVVDLNGLGVGRQAEAQVSFARHPPQSRGSP
jgi:hypothetical protein